LHKGTHALQLSGRHVVDLHSLGFEFGHSGSGVLAANESRDFQRGESRKYAAAAVAELKAKGMQINDVPAAELQRMSTLVQPVKNKFAAAYDPAIVNLFFAELDRVRK
ncbi:MAG: hypothetical protein ACKOWD_12635, partial [Rhodoferax sp.]